MKYGQFHNSVHSWFLKDSQLSMFMRTNLVHISILISHKTRVAKNAQKLKKSPYLNLGNKNFLNFPHFLRPIFLIFTEISSFSPVFPHFFFTFLIFFLLFLIFSSHHFFLSIFLNFLKNISPSSIYFPGSRS